jgi:hypothetical protein
VLEDALARFEHQVQAVEGAVALFEAIDDAQALQVVLEAAMPLHALVERILAGVAERGMAEVVGQRDGFGQVVVETRARATERAIWATSMLCVRRVRNRSPSWLTKTWVLYSRRRKAVECTMRSRSRWNSLRTLGRGSACARPRLLPSLTA